jgi:hypothetical protein
MPLVKRKRWLSGKRACELLGIDDTAKTPATSRLASSAERWGIRKIRRGKGKSSTVVYPEQDLYDYMERKEKEAADKIAPFRRTWRSIDPKDLKLSAPKKWLNARAVVYLLGMVTARAEDTQEQIKEMEGKAVRLLGTYGMNWGIRIIVQRGKIKKSYLACPEDDVLAYMRRREREIQELGKYMRYHPTYYPPVVGPGLCKWWGDKKLELELQIGRPVKRTGKTNARFIPVEVEPDNSILPLRGYVDAVEVAQRFNLPTNQIYGSSFWAQFCIYLSEPWSSSKRYNGDLIELYFKEKQEAGEKVYRLTRSPDARAQSAQNKGTRGKRR